MRHAPGVQRPSSPLSRQRLLLLAAVVLPLVAATTLLLRPSGEVLSTVDVADVGVAHAVAALPRPAVGPDGQVLRLVSGGRDRAVLVHDPAAGQAARGLVIVLGPHSLSAARTARDLRFDDLRARGYAVAYPSTIDGDWNAGRCCGTPHAEGVDDVAFLQQVRRQLLDRYRLTDRAVGLVGYSTGGQMVYRTVCSDPSFARAAVVVSGSFETECTPSAPLPATLVVHGLDDATIPWATSTGPIRMLDHTPSPGLASVTAYAAAGGCGGSVLDTSDGRTLLQWPGCERLAALTAVGMPGTGHGWTPLGASIYVTRFLPPHLEDP